MSRNDIILAVVAAALVGFSLLVSLVAPGRWPDFPGRHLRLFVVIAVLLILGMLTSVEVLGESHHFAAETGQPTNLTNESPTASAPTTTASAPTSTEQQPQGDPAAGKQIFTATAQPQCSSCHTLQEANATGSVGPNLDDALKGKDAAFIHESIVDPNAEVASGYQPGIMPETYDQQLDDKQLADLVAFLVQATS